VRPVVAAVQAKSPAQAMGLKAGDRIVSINGTTIRRFGQARTAIGGSNGQPVTVVVSRDGKTVSLPAAKPMRTDGRWILGFNPDVVYRTHGVSAVQAPREAAGDIWRITSGTMGALAHVVSPQGRQQISSTVGIVRYTATVADIGAAYYLSVIALISLSLAIFNLLPFLPLDGGHVVMIAAERLRGGRPLSRGVYERASVVGIMLMMLLFVIGLQNDVNSIISNSP
jgi:regulator of sigma E protease